MSRFSASRPLRDRPIDDFGSRVDINTPLQQPNSGEVSSSAQALMNIFGVVEAVGRGLLAKKQMEQMQQQAKLTELGIAEDVEQRRRREESYEYTVQQRERAEEERTRAELNREQAEAANRLESDILRRADEFEGLERNRFLNERLNLAAEKFRDVNPALENRFLQQADRYRVESSDVEAMERARRREERADRSYQQSIAADVVAAANDEVNQLLAENPNMTPGEIRAAMTEIYDRRIDGIDLDDADLDPVVEFVNQSLNERVARFAAEQYARDEEAMSAQHQDFASTLVNEATQISDPTAFGEKIESAMILLEEGGVPQSRRRDFIENEVIPSAISNLKQGDMTPEERRQALDEFLAQPVWDSLGAAKNRIRDDVSAFIDRQEAAIEAEQNRIENRANLQQRWADGGRLSSSEMDTILEGTQLGAVIAGGTGAGSIFSLPAEEAGPFLEQSLEELRLIWVGDGSVTPDPSNPVPPTVRTLIEEAFTSDANVTPMQRAWAARAFYILGGQERADMVRGMTPAQLVAAVHGSTLARDGNLSVPGATSVFDEAAANELSRRVMQVYSRVSQLRGRPEDMVKPQREQIERLRKATNAVLRERGVRDFDVETRGGVETGLVMNESGEIDDAFDRFLFGHAQWLVENTNSTERDAIDQTLKLLEAGGYRLHQFGKGEAPRMIYDPQGHLPRHVKPAEQEERVRFFMNAPLSEEEFEEELERAGIVGDMPRPSMRTRFEIWKFSMENAGILEEGLPTFKKRSAFGDIWDSFTPSSDGREPFVSMQLQASDPGPEGVPIAFSMSDFQGNQGLVAGDVFMYPNGEPILYTETRFPHEMYQRAKNRKLKSRRESLEQMTERGLGINTE